MNNYSQQPGYYIDKPADKWYGDQCCVDPYIRLEKSLAAGACPHRYRQTSTEAQYANERLKDGEIERLKEELALMDNGVADVLVCRVDGKIDVERWKD
jgi:hypothetical protein